MDLDTLRASRKADRETIAAALIAIAEKHGATVTRRDDPPHKGWSGAGIALSFKLNGVGAMIDVDDLHERHGSAGGLLSWYNDAHQIGSAVQKFSGRFNCAVGDMGQYRPHHKATTIGTWGMCAERLDAGLALAAAGEAFRPVEVEAQP